MFIIVWPLCWELSHQQGTLKANSSVKDCCELCEYSLHFQVCHIYVFYTDHLKSWFQPYIQFALIFINVSICSARTLWRNVVKSSNEIVLRGQGSMSHQKYDTLPVSPHNLSSVLKLELLHRWCGETPMCYPAIHCLFWGLGLIYQKKISVLRIESESSYITDQPWTKSKP